MLYKKLFYPNLFLFLPFAFFFSCAELGKQPKLDYSELKPDIKQVADGLVFPEGPVWLRQGYLVFSDVHGEKIMELKPNGGAEVFFDKGLKTNGLILSNDGKKIYACCYSARALIEIDIESRLFKVLTDSFENRKFNNVNDVAIDKAGNVYFTDPKWGAQPGDIQGVYCFTKEGKTVFSTVVDNQPNGIVVSPGGKYMYIDRSGADDIWRYKIDGDGKLSEGKLFAQLEKGAEPDGMTIDKDGNLFVAEASKGKIAIISREGKVINTIDMPEKFVTNCEFDIDNPNILYVTTAGKQELKIGKVFKVIFKK